MLFAGVVLLVSGSILCDILLQACLDLEHQPLDRDFARKVYNLLVAPKRTPRILITGDSRAERQMIPEVFQQQLGVDAVNVALRSGELISIVKIFQKYGILETKPILVISATIFQVNDGAVDHDTIGLDSVMAMRWIDQVVLFRKKLPEMAYRKIQAYADCLEAALRDTDIREKRYPEDGYVGIDRNVDASVNLADYIDLDPDKMKHPWYQDLRIDGKRWQVFREALDRLAESGSPIIIINPPSSPLWQEFSEGSFIDAAERQYSQMLDREAARYPNVYFLDMHSGWRGAFTNAMFYDIQHLNRTGGTKLSQMLCDEILRLKILDHEPNQVEPHRAVSETLDMETSFLRDGAGDSMGSPLDEGATLADAGEHSPT